jgi:hypothetical protein
MAGSAMVKHFMWSDGAAATAPGKNNKMAASIVTATVLPQRLVFMPTSQLHSLGTAEYRLIADSLNLDCALPAISAWHSDFFRKPLKKAAATISRSIPYVELSCPTLTVWPRPLILWLLGLVCSN